MQTINIRNERGNFTTDPTDIKKNLKKIENFYSFSFIEIYFTYNKNHNF